MAHEASAAEQARYQVRFDWGLDGAAAIAGDADVIVWVDAIPTVGARLDFSALPAGAAVVEATMATADAVATWVLELQQRLNRRIAIAIVAAGETRTNGALRFAAEDLLAAGAVVDRLATRGLDATSPEAATAEGAYRHLGRAVAHLLTASVTAASTTTPSTALRLDDTLTAADVIVRRQHPEA